jgi:DNA-binding CsgD family transcriptional regulator
MIDREEIEARKAAFPERFVDGPGEFRVLRDNNGNWTAKGLERPAEWRSAVEQPREYSDAPVKRDVSPVPRVYQNPMPGVVMFNGRVVGESGLKRVGRPPINRKGKGIKSLTPKLREVAELAAKGMLAREIAHRTTYTLGTVRVILTTEIYPALGVRNREELAEWWSANVEPVPPMLKGRPTCKVTLPDGTLCGKPSQGKCLCATHYSQQRRAKQRGTAEVKR